jgi:pimeloyl-ACP methyl ester carboxylesterase
VGGLRLHRLEYAGDDAGDTVVCVHGVTGHAWLWHDVATSLAPRRLLAVDLRGHGDSQWSAHGAYATDDHASDLTSLLESLEVGPVHLVGLSWGGLVALRVAASSPQLVKTLAVVDVPLWFEQGPSDVPERPYSFAGHEEVVAWERQANPHAPDELLELAASFGVRPGKGGTFVRKYDPFFARTWPFRTCDHRGDWETVDAHRRAIRATRPELEPLYEVLAEATAR